MRIQRKRLRDQMDTFDMSDKTFIQVFRLNKQCTIALINTLHSYVRIGNGNSVSFLTKVLTTLNFLSVGSFQNSRTSGEEAFNDVLISARNVIERTNGILKGRFRCFSKHRSLVYHLVKTANIIYACCVLHNMAIKAGLQLDEAEIEYQEQENNTVNNPAGIDGDILELGREARAAYMRQNN